MKDLELQRKSLPNEPGVYLFKDNSGRIIYVGKAINLKKRVSSYFLKTSYNDPYYEDKIKELVKQIHSIEYIVTENEKEALILENIQIKEHNPFFNARMRDSKTYPWIAFFYSEEFPRINIIRNPQFYGEANTYLGPYTDKKEISRILRDLRKIFPYCSCKKPVTKKKRPCLYYQIKLCPGPCYSEVSREEYINNLKSIELFLKGETYDLKKQIESKMLEASENHDFETAAFWRDKLQAIDHSTVNQSVLLDQEENKDIIGFSIDKDQKYAALVLIHIREGKITLKSDFTIDIRKKLILQEEDILASLLEQYYQDPIRLLPERIIVSQYNEELSILKEVLRDKKGDMDIRAAINDNEKGLLRIANKNAKVIVNQQVEMEEIKQREDEKIQKALEEAKEILNLPTIPRIIEGFDISNIEGQDATGSMVYFLEGKPYNRYYRHYKIRSKSTPDDVTMMKEVIKRRYSFLLDKGYHLPDLVLVDGGKGQLNAAVSVLEDLGISKLPVIGLAKREEEIFIPYEKNPIVLARNSQLLKIFQRIRDEAHRFAVRLHKKQRKKRTTKSILDEIKGIGPSTRNKLLKHFGSVRDIKKASFEQLNKVVAKNVAETIVKYFKENN
ncbi:MAG: excinuclease ABC subunit UvrC [Promethearchaeota archaeon]